MEALPKLRCSSGTRRAPTQALRSLSCFMDTLMQCSKDTLAEWPRRPPAKPMGSPRVGSNPTGVVRSSRDTVGYHAGSAASSKKLRHS